MAGTGFPKSGRAGSPGSRHLTPGGLKHPQGERGRVNTMPENPMELFRREAPEVAEAFNGLIMALVASRGLDQKTKQLIYIAMKAAVGDDTAVKAHLPMAKQAGATREEVVDAILMTLTVSGIRGVVHCLPDAVKAFEK